MSDILRIQFSFDLKNGMSNSIVGFMNNSVKLNVKSFYIIKFTSFIMTKCKMCSNDLICGGCWQNEENCKCRGGQTMVTLD